MRGFTGLSMAVLVAAGLNTVPAGSPDACENRPGCVCERHESRQNVPACHRPAPDPNRGTREPKGCCCLRSAPFEAPATFVPAPAGRSCMRIGCLAALCGPAPGVCHGPCLMATAPPERHPRAVTRPRTIPRRC